MDILRFITAGSVDDGKSTLTGRLLLDTNNIKKDILQSVSAGSDIDNKVNLAFITDGLRAEREQGITIDVAYKYFTTPTRKYIITDAPGHFQYTRNLVTGASSADVMIILIDALNGITAQTRKHSLAASFLKMNQVIIAVNKMDLVNYDENVFNKIKQEYTQLARTLELNFLTFIPLSALLGENVTFPSHKMPWYSGNTLLQYLETWQPKQAKSGYARFSVQYVIETGENGFEKGFAGRLLSGSLRVGDEIEVFPSCKKGVIVKMLNGFNKVESAGPGQNLVIYFNKGTIAERGDMVSLTQNPPACIKSFKAELCWLDTSAALLTDKEYIIRINGKETPGKITAVLNKVDNESLIRCFHEKPIEANDFAAVTINTKEQLALDTFHNIPENGRGIIIDPASNYTSGAFTINSF